MDAHRLRGRRTARHGVARLTSGEAPPHRGERDRRCSRRWVRAPGSRRAGTDERCDFGTPRLGAASSPAKPADHRGTAQRPVPLVIIQRVYCWRVPRPPLYSTDEILDAARELVLTGGARAATLDAIVAASGAPKGSIYHRFPTLHALLAAMGGRSVRRSQACFIAELELEDAYEAAVAAGLAIHDFALAHPGDARLLASLRRVDLVESVTDPQLSASLEGLNDPLVE